MNKYSFAVTLCLGLAFASTYVGGSNATAAPNQQSGGKIQMAQAHTSMITTPSGLQYQDLKVGNGTSPRTGQTVTVNYTGWLTNGQKFDSSIGRGPFQFHIGHGEVIPGWDEGVASMKIGGKRKLIIPAQLGYGPRGMGNVIPPNSTLVFEVELLGVQ